MKWVECVAFMLIRDGQVLAERRKLSKPLLPGAVALPGGHMEAGEAPETTLAREVAEELGVQVVDSAYVCTLLERVEVNGIPGGRRLHYYCVTRWTGEIQVHEADAVLWVGLDQPSRLEPYVDRLAVAEYLRIYQND